MKYLKPDGDVHLQMVYFIGGILFWYTWKNYAKTQNIKFKNNNQNKSGIVLWPQNKKQLAQQSQWLRIIIEDNENISPNELNC